jgi:thioesterase III
MSETNNFRKSTKEIQVRGYHLDIYQHVNNARYLEFLEEGRWSHYDGLDGIVKLQTEKLGFVVVNINISYLNQSTNGDLISISTQIKQVNEKTIIYEQIITIKGTEKVVVKADITAVIVDLKIGKAVKLTPEILKHLD